MPAVAPRSLQTRLVASATASLALFLAIAGWILDQAFRDGVETADYNRLRSQVYMLLGVADELSDRGLTLPSLLPDPRLSTPASGLYAQLIDADGTVIWKSQSMIGLALPGIRVRETGDFERATLQLSDGTPVRAVSYGVIWELDSGEDRRYTIQVAEDLTGYSRQVRRFRRSMLLWFGAVVIALLPVQFLILRWGLNPIREMAAEVSRVETGAQERIVGVYPKELSGLTANLNMLLQAAQGRLMRYRNALGDLAHSLKTPLAVMRNALESPGEQRELLREQLDTLDRSIEYQLKKAAAVGASALLQPIDPAPVLERLVASLRKVYAARRLNISLTVAPGTRFYGDQGDLYEMAGNVIDNACKWARGRVSVAATSVPSPGARQPFRLAIEDDGPGIPPESIDAVLERGTRADQRAPGHGIGLAVVRELVEEVYRGRLQIDSGSTGTRVTIDIAFG